MDFIEKQKKNLTNLRGYIKNDWYTEKPKYTSIKQRIIENREKARENAGLTQKFKDISTKP